MQAVPATSAVVRLAYGATKVRAGEVGGVMMPRSAWLGVGRRWYTEGISVGASGLLLGVVAGWQAKGCRLRKALVGA